jgi:hypothetical protein
MFNKSVGAQFLVPMAVSLSWGVVFATVVTLLVVPSGYLILNDLRKLLPGLPGTSDQPAGSSSASR